MQHIRNGGIVPLPFPGRPAGAARPEPPVRA